MARSRNPTLQLAARDNSGDVDEALGSLGLGSAREKSENMLMSPNDAVEDLHRRRPSDRRKGLFQEKERGDQLNALREHVEPPAPKGATAAIASAAPPETKFLPLPFTTVPAMKVLGLVIDHRF